MSLPWKLHLRPATPPKLAEVDHKGRFHLAASILDIDVNTPWMLMDGKKISGAL